MRLNKFDQFLHNRESLIEHYKKGDLSKEEFIESTYNCVLSLQIEPFKKIDNVKKAIFNYQYYNVMAKYYQKKAHDTNKNNYSKKDYFEMSNNYYYKKDTIVMKYLKLIDYFNVEAYYVKVNSPSLKNKLFEIVTNEEFELIFHSKNEILLNLLKHQNVFIAETRKSITDNYINQKF